MNNLLKYKLLHINSFYLNVWGITLFGRPVECIVIMFYDTSSVRFSPQ